MNCYKMEMQTLWPIFRICLSIVHSRDRNLAHSTWMFADAWNYWRNCFHRFLCVFDCSWLIVYTFVENCFRSRVFYFPVSLAHSFEKRNKFKRAFFFFNSVYYEWKRWKKKWKVIISFNLSFEKFFELILLSTRQKFFLLSKVSMHIVLFDFLLQFGCIKLQIFKNIDFYLVSVLQNFEKHFRFFKMFKKNLRDFQKIMNSKF